MIVGDCPFIQFHPEQSEPMCGKVCVVGGGLQSDNSPGQAECRFVNLPECRERCCLRKFAEIAEMVGALSWYGHVQPDHILDMLRPK